MKNEQIDNLLFTIKRKNFVFIQSDKDAKVSAMIYIIVETTKANEIDIYKYPELLLT